MRRRNKSGRSPVTPEVISLRRRVLRVRLTVSLAAVVVVASWYTYWDIATASLRRPEVALAEDSQVFAAAEAFLVTQSAQLSLRATITDFSRVGRPGPIAPHSASRQGSTNMFWLQVPGYGSVTDSGAPLVGPVVSVIKDHTLGRGGTVSRITVECTYVVCWDRKTTVGRRTLPGEEMPTGPGELVDGRAQYSDREQVTDRLVFTFATRRARWEVMRVQRLSTVRVTSGH